MDPEDERELEKLKREKRKAEKKDNLKEVAQIHNCIGELLYKYERYEEAIGEHESERAISEALQDTIGEAVACRKIGECYCAIEQYTKALQLQQRHLSLAKACDCDIEEQRAWATIGRTYLFQSETCRGHSALEASKKAEKAFVKALEVCKRLKSSVKNEELMEMRARLYLNLGLVYDGQGDVKQSADFMKRAITIAEKYRLTSDVYRCQISLAGMYQRRENWSQCLRSLEEAQKCAVKLKDKLLENEVYTNKAQILMRIGDFSMAKHCLKKAYKLRSATVTEDKRVLKLFKSATKMEECSEELEKEDVDVHARFKLYEKLGDAAADASNFKQAIDFYLNMLECGQQLQISKVELIPIYVSLAQTYADDKQFTEAVKYYRKELACRTDEPDQVCRTWLNIAEAEELGGSSYEKISQSYLSAFESARKAKNRKLQIQVLKSLIEVQKLFKQRTHQQQTADKLEKLRAKYDINSADELSDSELDTQQSEEEDNISIAELTESEGSDDETSTTTGSVRRRNQTKPKVNEKGETQLHRACIEGNVKKVKSLLEKGHPVNPRDYCGWIPLHEAANHDYYEVVKVLLENGAAVNDRGGKHCGGITPLIDAANCGNTEIIKLLLSYRASVYNKDDEGQTALDCLKAWHQRCEDTLTREMQASYVQVEGMLSDLMRGGKCPSSRPIERQPSHLDLYDDESAKMSQSQGLPEVKVRSKRKRSSTGGKSARPMIASDSEGEDRQAEMVNDIDSQEIDIYRNPRLDDLISGGSATDDYRSAMHSIGSATQRSAVRPSQVDRPVSLQTSTTALLDANEFIDDDWLIDDLQPQKRKRVDVGSLFSTSGTRKSSSDSKSKSDKRPRSFVLEDKDESSNEAQMMPGCDFLGDDDDDIVMTVPSGDNIPKLSNRSRLTTKKARQTKLTNYTSSDTSGSLTQSVQGVCDGLLSSTPSGLSSTSSISNNPAESLTSVMRLKVTIEGQMLLVPVPNTNETISWLAQDVSKRYEKIHQKRPLVTLRTRDGAILSPDDVVSMVLSNNEVLDACVDSWDMQPLHERYRQACKVARTVVYRNIESVLQTSDVTATLELRNLALRPSHLLPVCRALEGQNTLKHLNLQNNRLGDNGMSTLAKTLSFLPSLSSLNVTGNEITTVGLKSLTDSLEAAQQTASKPLQILTILNLSHNPMGDNSTTCVTSLLSYLPSLTDLSLKACHLTSKFFSQHRLMLAGAMQASSMNSLDISYNRLGSLGLEQLLRCLNHAHMVTLDLSETHAGTSISHLSLHLQQFLAQDGCVLEDLRLASCHLSPDEAYFVTKLPSISKKIRKLNLSCNSKLDNSVVQELLQECVRNDCSLEELQAHGCAIRSPLDSNFLDSLNDKLNSELHPLRKLVFTCQNLDKVDIDCLTQIWSDKWKELSKIDISGLSVKLDVQDSQ